MVIVLNCFDGTAVFWLVDLFGLISCTQCADVFTSLNTVKYKVVKRFTWLTNVNLQMGRTIPLDYLVMWLTAQFFFYIRVVSVWDSGIKCVKAVYAINWIRLHYTSNSELTQQYTRLIWRLVLIASTAWTRPFALHDKMSSCWGGQCIGSFIEIDWYGFFVGDISVSTIHGLIADTDNQYFHNL